ncbi:MAG: hypothetical protein KBF58_07965 [Methyloversatilis sp.]|nr:hypothetical protein [Methyloversatilis sp.]
MRHVAPGLVANKARDAVETGCLDQACNAVRGQPRGNPQGVQPVRLRAALHLLA